jgi:hypothetical protein
MGFTIWADLIPIGQRRKENIEADLNTIRSLGYEISAILLDSSDRLYVIGFKMEEDKEVPSGEVYASGSGG